MKKTKKVRYLAGVGAGCAPALALAVPATAARAEPVVPRAGKTVTLPHAARVPAAGCTGKNPFSASLGNIKFHGWDAVSGWLGSYECVGTVVVQLQFNIKDGEYLCKSAKLELDSATYMSAGVIWVPFFTRVHSVCRTGPGTASTSFAAHQSHLQPVLVEVRSQYDGGHPAWYNTANGNHTVR